MWNLHPQNCPSLELNYLQNKFCLYQACTNFLPLIVVYYNNGCLCTICSVFIPVDCLEIISSAWAAMHRLFPHAASIMYGWGLLRFGFLMGLDALPSWTEKHNCILFNLPSPWGSFWEEDVYFPQFSALEATKNPYKPGCGHMYPETGSHICQSNEKNKTEEERGGKPSR